MMTAISEDSLDGVSGILTVDDIDQGEALFIPQVDVGGNYGTFNVTSDGNWTYHLNNELVQYLGLTESLQETFTVTSLDQSSTTEVQVTINGENDAPVNEIHDIEGFRVKQQRIWIPISATDVDQNNTQFTHEYRIVRVSDEHEVASGSLGDVNEFSFTVPSAGNYRIELITADMHGEEATTQREITVAEKSTVELSFSRDSLAIAGSTSIAPETDLRFHEWEEVVGHLWFTIEDGLPNHPFDIQFEITSSEAWLGMPEVIDYWGSDLQWTVQGNTVTGALTGVDLTEYQIGDRVLLATLQLPKDLENEAGLSMADEGQYPQAVTHSGISLTDARADSWHRFAIHTATNAEFVPVIYDANDDGKIGVTDFAQFISNYGKTPDENTPDAYRFDYDGDGRVGVRDFSLFIRHYAARKSGNRPIDMPLFDAQTPEPPAVPPPVLETEPPPPILDPPPASELELVYPYPRFLESGGLILQVSPDYQVEPDLLDLEFIDFCGTPDAESGDVDARLIDAIFHADETETPQASSPWDDEHPGLLTPEELEDSVL
ncbi:VCBS domain-containing protein [Bremerella sp. JC770]|uniref:VCBS domain-containing protein n=1 Tax=Bremerella sp. JC770 TaxID=3232137 RepID=UPI003458A7C6